MEDYRKYLKPEVISKLKSFELKAKFIVEGFITGLHQSPYHGFSVEFAEHRQYSFGDETRHIDWRVLGRTGKYYIKQYEEETNLRCYILLDTSSSMRYTSDKKFLPKIEYASYVAASLALLMVQQRDAIGLITYSDHLLQFFPPSLKQSNLNNIFKTLSETSRAVTESRGTLTNSAKALKQFAERVDKRSLIVVISDLWDEPEQVIAALKHFHHRHHEVVVFHILDKQERYFNFENDSEIVDLESGDVIATNPRQIKEAYQTALAEHIHHYKQALTDNNIDYNLIDTSESFDLALLAYLRKRSKLN